MSNATKKRVKRSRKKAVCVRADCNEPAAPGCRGDCKLHYHQFNYAKRLKPTEEAKERFDIEEVAKGNILPSARGKCRNRPNPYLRAV